MQGLRVGEAGQELLCLAPLVLEDVQEVSLGDLRDVGLIIRHVFRRRGARDRRDRHATLRGPLGVPALPLAGPGNRASRARAAGIRRKTCSNFSREPGGLSGPPSWVGKGRSRGAPRTCLVVAAADTVSCVAAGASSAAPIL